MIKFSTTKMVVLTAVALVLLMGKANAEEVSAIEGAPTTAKGMKIKPGRCF